LGSRKKHKPLGFVVQAVHEPSFSFPPAVKHRKFREKDGNPGGKVFSRTAFKGRRVHSRGFIDQDIIPPFRKHQGAQEILRQLKGDRVISVNSMPP
jgi:hypothetical protein